MKSSRVVLAIMMTIVLFGCSGASKSGSGNPPPSGYTNMDGGTWTINMQGSGINDTFGVTFGSSACTPVGTLLENFTVTGPVCFDASGQFPPQQNNAPFEFLMGVPANPVPPDSTVSFLYGVEGGDNSTLVVFLATGQVSGTNWAGTWGCDSPAVCGTSGTFTATLATGSSSARTHIANIAR